MRQNLFQSIGLLVGLYLIFLIVEFPVTAVVAIPTLFRIGLLLKRPSSKVAIDPSN